MVFIYMYMACSNIWFLSQHLLYLPDWSPFTPFTQQSEIGEGLHSQREGRLREEQTGLIMKV